MAFCSLFILEMYTLFFYFKLYKIISLKIGGSYKNVGDIFMSYYNAEYVNEQEIMQKNVIIISSKTPKLFTP